MVRNFFLRRTIPWKKVINESLMTNSKVFSSGENVLIFVWISACDPTHTWSEYPNTVLHSLNYDRLPAQDQHHYRIMMIHQVPIKSWYRHQVKSEQKENVTRIDVVGRNSEWKSHQLSLINFTFLGWQRVYIVRRTEACCSAGGLPCVRHPFTD